MSRIKHLSRSHHAFLASVLALCFSLFAVSEAFSSDWCKSSSSDCTEVGEWKVALGVGLGVRTNPVVDSDDIPLILLPSVSYYGKRFYFENLNLGYQLIEEKRHDFSLIVTPGRDHLFFNRWSLGNFSVNGTEASRVNALVAPTSEGGTGTTGDGGSSSNDNVEYSASLKNRRLSILAGMDWHYYLDQFTFGIQALKDVRGIHDGSELRAAISYEQEFGFTTISTALGFIWQDENSIDYYYGVDMEEVNNSSFTYRAGSGISPFVRLDLGYKLNKRWTLKATAYYRDLASSISDSPIVEESGFTTVFLGGVYHF